MFDRSNYPVWFSEIWSGFYVLLINEHPFRCVNLVKTLEQILECSNDHINQSGNHRADWDGQNPSPK